MSKTHCIVRLVSFGLIGCSAGGASGQEYPSRPIRIVTSPAGGGNDFPARLIARGISGPLDQQVVVDNRPTVLLAELVSKAAPDGYTLLVTGSAHWIGPLLEKVGAPLTERPLGLRGRELGERGGTRSPSGEV